LSPRTQIPAAVGALLCLLVSGACRQQASRAAEARARAWGVPAVRIAHDLVYAAYGQRQLKLDVYLPPERAQRGAVPGVLVVRGGKWRHGDKEFSGYIAGQLAMEGFVTAAIEYRTSDEAKFPAAVQDVKAAVRWMRAHAAAYGVNPRAIGAIGGSAGAHLVAMLATSGGVTHFEVGSDNSGTSSDVQAVVAMGGAYNLQPKDGMGVEFLGAVTGFIGAPLAAHREKIIAASPVTYVDSRSAPLLLLHSRTDPLVPFEQSAEMERLYRRAGAPVTLTAIEAPRSHAFWADPRYFPETKQRAVRFFRRNLHVPE